MGIIGILIGIFLIAIGLAGTYKGFYDLLKDDLKGFAPWFIALSLVYSIRLIRPLEPVSNYFLVLVALVLFLRQGGGFFDKFSQQTGIKL